MKTLIEILWAVLLVGVPLALFTMAIVGWALYRGYFRHSSAGESLARQIKTMKMSGVDDPVDGPETGDFFHRKWAKFGGGFYGIVAFFTYIVIEVLEVIGVIAKFGGFIDFLKGIDPGLLVNMFVQALTNFISAMVWPVYWMRRIDTDQTWLWFVIAYLGYLAGLRVAQVLHQRRVGGVL